MCVVLMFHLRVIESFDEAGSLERSFPSTLGTLTINRQFQPKRRSKRGFWGGGLGFTISVPDYRLDRHQSLLETRTHDVSLFCTAFIFPLLVLTATTLLPPVIIGTTYDTRHWSAVSKLLLNAKKRRENCLHQRKRTKIRNTRTHIFSSRTKQFARRVFTKKKAMCTLLPCLYITFG